MEKKLPLVSIVTPSYNKGRFIEETIISVKNQTYPRIEHIVVDGGSTDGTLDILNKYGDSITWISGPDKGQSDAINKGWKMSKGEIIAYLNADDTYVPGAVETAVRFLTDHPEVGMIYGDCNIIDEHGKIIGQFGASDFKVKNVLLGERCTIPQPATFLRRTVLDDIGYVDIDLHMAMDLDLWIRTALRFKIQRIPQILANFRLYIGTKSLSRINPFWQDRQAILDKTFSDPALPADLKSIKQKAYASMTTQVAFHEGRLALINRNWVEARRNFKKALVEGTVPTKIKALTGLVCSYCTVNMEWLAAALNKPRLK